MKLKTGQQSQDRGVLFLGGSFNPVHFNHVHVLRTVKCYLEEKHSVQVVSGQFVPSTHDHIESKIAINPIPSALAMSFETRKILCELAALHFNQKHPSDSFSLQVSQKPYRNVLDYVSDFVTCNNHVVQPINKHEKLFLVVCMGEDIVIKYNKSPQKWNLYFSQIESLQVHLNTYLPVHVATIVVKRRGFNADLTACHQLASEHSMRIDFLDIDDPMTISSTKIRRMVYFYKKSDDQVQKRKYYEKLCQMMGRNCVNYILMQHYLQRRRKLKTEKCMIL